MLPAPVTLLDRDMLFVTGKGGVGKTTVTAALALAGARTGRRTIVCELAGQARIPALLGAAAGAVSAETPVAEGLWATTIESHVVMEEWIASILGSRSLTALLTRSNFFRGFADAAPGGRELGEMVKTWELVEGHRWDRQRAGYDLVIVDGPASGHAIGMLGAPGTFADVARVGPIASQSRKVREWLADATRTAFVGVALPGELPVTETLELSDALGATIGRRFEAIFVNEVLPDRFSEREAAQLAGDSDAALAVRAQIDRSRAQERHIERLEDGVDASVVRLPFLYAPQLERVDVELLADALMAHLP
jgi:anion-transporting  ArsA/GET3 family ATPase